MCGRREQEAFRRLVIVAIPGAHPKRLEASESAPQNVHNSEQGSPKLSERRNTYADSGRKSRNVLRVNTGQLATKFLALVASGRSSNGLSCNEARR